MGVELELGMLLGLAIVGQSVFAVFEVETAAWRKIVKWAALSAATLALYGASGHWALIVPVAGGALGASFHFWWCRRHGIHPLRATPRRRYYRLRGWPWPSAGESEPDV